jgi:hypothetical protein
MYLEFKILQINTESQYSFLLFFKMCILYSSAASRRSAYSIKPFQVAVHLGIEFAVVRGRAGFEHGELPLSHFASL